MATLADPPPSLDRMGVAWKFHLPLPPPAPYGGSSSNNSNNSNNNSATRNLSRTSEAERSNWKDLLETGQEEEEEEEEEEEKEEEEEEEEEEWVNNCWPLLAVDKLLQDVAGAELHFFFLFYFFFGPGSLFYLIRSRLKTR